MGKYNYKDLEEDRSQTQFNSGLAKLERIHRLKQIIHYSRLQNDWESFYFSLCGIRAELNERMENKEMKLSDDHERKILTVLEYNKKNKAKRFIELFLYERYLNFIEFKNGMSMVDKDDDEGL